jgi:tetratricopeptide (TPR) repeat protein
LMINKYKSLFVISALVLLFFGQSLFKASQFRKLPGYNYSDDTALFKTEAAFQYRYAKLYALHGVLPAVDYMAQYPEGVNVRREFTTLMEKVSGNIYRIFLKRTRLPFHVFIIYFISFFSSLPVFSVFLLAKLVSRKNLPALVSAGFYCVARVSFMRVIVGGFEYEIFAFPLITFGIYFFLLSLRKRSYALSALASVFFTAALLSWHFTGFFLAAFVLALCACYFSAPERDAGFLAGALGLNTAVFFAAGLTAPVLSAKYFNCSPAMTLCYALLLAHLARRLKPEYAKYLPLFFLLAAAVIFASSAAAFPANRAEYGHVFSLFKYKLIYLNDKPADPKLLPFDAAVLWEGAFERPDLRQSVYLFSSLAVLGLVPWALNFRKYFSRKLDPAESALFAATAASFAMYLLARRLHIFAGFFLCVYAACWPGLFSGKPKNARTLAAVFLALCFAYEAGEFASYGMPGVSTPMKKLRARELDENRESRFSAAGEEKLLAQWARSWTPPGTVFLAPFQTSPALLAYADRAVVLHPKFESGQIRGKYKLFVNALFSDEETFYRLCRDFKADYFVYQIFMLFDSSKASLQYLALYPEISRESAIYKFNFNPSGLRHFALIRDLRSSRVFRVLKDGETAPGLKQPYNAVFDPAVFDSRKGEYLDPADIRERFPRLLEKDMCLDSALRAARQGQPREAKYFLDRALATGIPDQKAWSMLGEIYLSMNSPEKAIESFGKALEIEPAYMPPYLGTISALGFEGRHKEALTMAKKTISVFSGVPEPYVLLGLTYENMKDYANALAAFGTALRLDPSSRIAAQKYEEMRSALSPAQTR